MNFSQGDSEEDEDDMDDDALSDWNLSEFQFCCPNWLKYVYQSEILLVSVPSFSDSKFF